MGWDGFPQHCCLGCDGCVGCSRRPQGCPSSEPVEEQVWFGGDFLSPCSRGRGSPPCVRLWPRAQGGERGGRWRLVGGSLL